MPVLKPAHGRVYRTFHEVSESYAQGFDFEGDVSVGFRLCSCRDFLGEIVELRFGDQCQFVSVEQVNEQEPFTDEMLKVNRLR